MSEEIIKAAERLLNAENVIRALNKSNGYNISRERDIEYARARALAEHELHMAQKEYNAVVYP